VSAVAKTTAPARSVRRIQRSSGLIAVDFGELWRYRQLLYVFIWRDVKARYKQTFLGPFWALFRPFVTMIMFSAIFGGLAGLTSGSSIPYPLFVYAGLLPWGYFSSAVGSSSASILNNAGLISKAYFPRLYAPFSAVTAPLPDLGFSVIIVAGLFVYFRVVPSWHIVFLPFFLLLAMLTALGVGLWLSGITVRYRDAGFALPFAIQLWMYATPIIYPVSKVPPEYRWLLAINPMTSVVNGFRWCLFATNTPSPLVTAISSVVVVLTVVTGLYWFRRTELTVADNI
jgi:lipopolysaccharide transport system permease protein